MKLPDEIRKAIREGIAEHLRPALYEAGLMSEPLPSLPPPTACEEERQVMGALVSREVSTTELGDLEPRHLYVGLNRWVFEKVALCEQAGVEVSAALLFAKATDEGICANGLQRELLDFERLPFVHPDRLARMVDKIIQAAEARKLIEKVQTVEFALRTGVRTPEQARVYLASLG